MKNNDLFPNIVGQDRAKKRLNFYLQGYNANGVMPHLMFIAPKGCGKTTLAKAMGKNMVSRKDTSKPKRFLEINCSTVKSVKQFFNQIVIPHINMQECTVLLDECSELPKDVTMMLLTVLNPNSENRTTFSYEDLCSTHLWIGASVLTLRNILTMSWLKLFVVFFPTTRLKMTFSRM